MVNHVDLSEHFVQNLAQEIKIVVQVWISDTRCPPSWKFGPLRETGTVPWAKQQPNSEEDRHRGGQGY